LCGISVYIPKTSNRPLTQKNVYIKLKRLVNIFIASTAIGILLTLAGLQVQAVERAPVKVTVLFFNDLHGHLLPFKVKTDKGKVEVGGIARISTLVKKIRYENNKMGIRTFVFIAGDILQGTLMSSIFKGRPDVECFNVIGVSAMTVGNHEFDFGMENFLNLKKMASFPFLSSNIVWKQTGALVCEPLATFHLEDNLSLSIIGVTTKELLTTTNPANVLKVAVLDPVQSVKDNYEKVKGKGPVILLSHSRHQTDRDIAETVPGIMAIIGGHDQILLSPYRRIGSVDVFQAFEKGRYLGRMDLEIDPVSKKADLVSNVYIPVTADINADPVVDKIVARYHDRMDKKYKEVIGQSAVFLDAEREKIRYEETNLGDFITDIMRDSSGAQIALLNSGSMRASIDSGPITVEDVFKTVPFSDEIVLIDIDGKELLQVLTRSVKGKREDEDGGFLHVSGIYFMIRGHNVENVRVGENLTPLDPARVYRVAVNDFLASGGDGYEIFAKKQGQYTGLSLRELVVDIIRKRGVVNARVDGRIVRK
jgi:5'-nucleotidase / UDP-sugar diphosphatase